jgi:oligopeptide/dipeptide ABC transporter ATP-binding protein
VADRAAVMYAGRVVEEASVGELFARPQHPYTAGLIGAVALDAVPPGTRLPEIRGSVPSLLALPAGCAFAPRCARVVDACTHTTPTLQAHGLPGQRSACFAPLSARVLPIVETQREAA